MTLQILGLLCFNDYFSGPDRVSDPVSVCAICIVCLLSQTIAFELDDL